MRKDYKSERDRCSLDPKREKNRGSLKERVRKIKLEREPEEASREERQLQQPRQIQYPSVFHPREKTRRECLASARAILAFHTDRESK